MQIHEFYFMVRVEAEAERQRKYPREPVRWWPRWLRLPKASKPKRRQI
jgi:hypothetical protein